MSCSKPSYPGRDHTARHTCPYINLVLSCAVSRLVFSCLMLRCAVLQCVTTYRDLLSDPRRFVVMSIESKLLVLLPTNTGHLVSVCVREFARSDDFTNEVVKTIMAVSNIGQPLSLYVY